MSESGRSRRDLHYRLANTFAIVGIIMLIYVGAFLAAKQIPSLEGYQPPFLRIGV